jgi:hypothetical protein
MLAIWCDDKHDWGLVCDGYYLPLAFDPTYGHMSWNDMMTELKKGSFFLGGLQVSFGAACLAFGKKIGD